MFKYDMILGRRLGRIGFGVVLLCGAGLILARIGPPHPLEPFKDSYNSQKLAPTEPHVSAILAVTWLLAFAVYTALASALRRRPCLPRQLLVPSLVVPGVGIALLLPLTLHLPFAVMFDGLGNGFDEWVYMSRDAVGHVHVVLAALVVVRAVRLAHGRRAPKPWTIFAITAAASFVPWGFVVLPPVIVMLTGMPFLPLLQRMETLVRDEHAALGGELPRAVVHAR